MTATRIEWAEHVWNPVTGCTPLATGCQNCYARRFANRLRGRCGYPADDPFRVTLHHDRLEEPLQRRKPTTYFVCSMGDLFHEKVPAEFVLRVFEIMAQAKLHRFLVLTKRPERMWYLLRYGDPLRCESAEHHRLLCTMPLPNVWLGYSASTQRELNAGLPNLLGCPAAGRFLSLEPLLEPVVIPGDALGGWQCACGGAHWPSVSVCHRCGRPRPEERGSRRAEIGWVIVGGETGPGARPMHPDWARTIRNQCGFTRVPFFFKQWGEWCPDTELQHAIETMTDPDFKRALERPHRWPRGFNSFPVGPAAAGRALDGQVWDEQPWPAQPGDHNHG